MQVWFGAHQFKRDVEGEIWAAGEGDWDCVLPGEGRELGPVFWWRGYQGGDLMSTWATEGYCKAKNHIFFPFLALAVAPGWTLGGSAWTLGNPFLPSGCCSTEQVPKRLLTSVLEISGLSQTKPRLTWSADGAGPASSRMMEWVTSRSLFQEASLWIREDIHDFLAEAVAGSCIYSEFSLKLLFFHGALQ